jgi:cell division protein FtsB
MGFLSFGKRTVKRIMMAGSPVQASRPDGGRLNLWPLALVALLLGFALFGDRGVLHMLKLSGQKAILAEKLAEFETQNEELRAEIEALRNDRHYIERIARKELGMVRDDELVFQFRDHK